MYVGSHGEVVREGERVEVDDGADRGRVVQVLERVTQRLGRRGVERVGDGARRLLHEDAHPVAVLRPRARVELRLDVDLREHNVIGLKHHRENGIQIGHSGLVGAQL